MREALRPGITENALWAELHHGNIAGGGEWIETRLLASGPRTNPWFRECSMRAIERGDMVSFDTDLIGPYGYCCDISRSWICDAPPNDEQRRIYADAHAHIPAQQGAAEARALLPRADRANASTGRGIRGGTLRRRDARGGTLRRVSRHPLPAGLGGGGIRRGLQGGGW